MSNTDLNVKIKENLYKSSLLQSKKKISGEIFKEPFFDILLTDLEQTSFSLVVPNLERGKNKGLYVTKPFGYAKPSGRVTCRTVPKPEVNQNRNFWYVKNKSFANRNKTEGFVFRNFWYVTVNFQFWYARYALHFGQTFDFRRLCKTEGKQKLRKPKPKVLVRYARTTFSYRHLLRNSPFYSGGVNLKTSSYLFALDKWIKNTSCTSDISFTFLSHFLQENRPVSCLLQIGDYVHSGDKLGYLSRTPLIISESGKVLKINQTQVTIQKIQPVLFYSQAEIHVESNEWVKRGTPLLTLAHQTLVTGDIVQGIPRIEQLFEASTSAPPGAALQDFDSHSLDDFSIPRKKNKQSSVDNYLKSQHVKQKTEASSIYRLDNSNLLPLPSYPTEIHNGDVSKVNGDTSKFVDAATRSNKVFLEKKNTSITGLHENGERKHDSTVYFATEEKPLFLYQTLQSQVRETFRKKWHRLPLPVAVRQSLEEIQQIIVESIQKVYISQGVLIADKHIEIIVRQMTSKAQVFDGGSTGLLIDEVLSLQQIENANISTPGQKALYLPVIMGLTQAALSSDSFVSAASFQETTRVLSRDAVAGKSDFLRGLKEKVIIGDLIDAGTGLDVFYIYSLFSKTIFENKFRDILNRKVTHKTLKKLVLTVTKCSPNGQTRQIAQQRSNKNLTKIFGFA